MHHLREFCTQRAVGADAPGHHQTLKAGLFQCAFAFDHQGIDHRVFERTGDISTGLLAIVVIANGIGREGFQTGKAEIQPWTVSHRTREDETPFRALRCHFREHRTARIIQTQQFGRFVEGLTGCVVNGLAEQLILANPRYANQLGMAT